MRILNKEVINAEFEWEENIVLKLEYSHRWEQWKILVKDYTDTPEMFKYVLKQLRVQVRNAYNLRKMKPQD